MKRLPSMQFALTKLALCTLLLLIFSDFCISQDHYRVFLTDKNDVEFDPYSYFDIKSIERKQKAGIPIDAISDYPLNQDYKNIISSLCSNITGESRWFNAVFCVASESEIESIKKLKFVRLVEKTEKIFCETTSLDTTDIEAFNFNYDANYNQIEIGQTAIHQGQLFKENNIQGQGKRIAILDVGFNHIDQIQQLEHLFSESLIIDTWDFIRNDVIDYNKGGQHGAMVLSCIAGIDGDISMGMAPKSQFLLARTERNLTEFKSEEENWLMAAEWADKNGADIINSSLGYTHRRYFQKDMNGHTAFVTKAANFAASKGILVVVSAGNEGDNFWITISAPADADSVLTVGGIEALYGFHSSWSSYGPTADFRLKPNVCAFGNAIVPNKYSDLTEIFGTSFSSPITAGFAACVWQLNPDASNMEIMEMIEKSGHLYPYYDYAHGYGIPQADYFIEQKANSPSLQKATFDYEIKGDMLYINVFEEFIVTSIETSEDFSTEEFVNYYDHITDPFLYYSISDSNGVLIKYVTIKVEEQEVVGIYIKDILNHVISINYQGFTHSYEIN